MKKMLVFLLIGAAILVLTPGLYAKKLNILNISKGEMPDDSSGCQIALTEEHADKEGEFAIKLVYDKRGWAGQINPKKGSWEGFKRLKFIVYNASDKPVKDVGVVLKGAKMSNGPDNRKDFKLEYPAGRSEQELSFVKIYLQNA